MIPVASPGSAAADHRRAANARTLEPTPVSPGPPPHVVAVLTDSAEAVRVARAAGELAAATGCPLAIAVPVPVLAPRFTVYPHEPADDQAQISQDAAAIAGRASPTLDRIGLPARVFSAPYRVDGCARSDHRAMASAIEDVARRLRAAAVVLSAASPVLPYLRIPAGELYLIEPVVQETPLARPSPSAPRPG